VGLGVVPAGVPLASCVVEVVGGGGAGIDPWLAALAIGEVAINPADSDVEDQVEFLVEGRSVGLIHPWVVAGKTASLPEALLTHINIEHHIALIVNVGHESVFGPKKTVGVETISERLRVLVLRVSHLVLILVPGGAPVQGRSVHI